MLKKKKKKNNKKTKKEEFFENSNISQCKNYNLLQKNPLKETKNPLRYY